MARIGSPVTELALPPFYARSIYVEGIPILGSSKVPDAALYATASLIKQMLSGRPDVARALVAREQRVVILAQEEGTSDVPEFAGLKKPTRDDPSLSACERKYYDEWIGKKTDAEYWNWRARGLGGDIVLGASENVLGVPGTSYYGENIIVHEFAHAMLSAIQSADTDLYRAVEEAYAAAHKQGLWQGEYGDTNVQEYWAEGVQFWFESNYLVVREGRRILSANDLILHDPALAAVIQRVFGDEHRLEADVFWRHPSRVPLLVPSTNTAPDC